MNRARRPLDTTMSHSSMPFFRSPRAGQRGVVLVLALIFLMLITILAVSASGTSLLQQHLVGGMRSSQMANMGAESAARGAEWRLWTASNSTPLACTTNGPNCYMYDATSPNAKVEKFRTAAGWEATGSTTYQAGKLTTTSTTTQITNINTAKCRKFILTNVASQPPSGCPA